MEKRVDKIINNNGRELIWFLNHDHIYTCGTSAKKNEILSQPSIPLIKTNRGGKTTYHGPGQRVIYFLLNLNNYKKDIRKFVTIIESSIINLLKEYKMEGKTYSDRIGIWIKSNNKEKKIGAVGLRIKKWVTYHGLSFNISPNLKYYDNILPCGLKNFSTTSMEDLKKRITVKEFDKKFIEYFFYELKNFK